LGKVVAEVGVELVNGDAKEGDGFDSSDVEADGFVVALGESDEASGFLFAIGLDGQWCGEWAERLFVRVVVLVEGWVCCQDIGMAAGYVEDAIESFFVEVVGCFPFLEAFPFSQFVVGDVLDQIPVEIADLLEDISFRIGAQPVGLSLVEREANRGEATVKIGLATIRYTGRSHAKG
jgi:hypothetical protein